jgi:serine/threonine protein kinase
MHLFQSLGCVLFALAYLHSPFENLQTAEHGGSIAMAVMSARYRHPSNSTYSQGFKELVDSMLKIDPRERPDIHRVCYPLSNCHQIRSNYMCAGVGDDGSSVAWVTMRTSL